MSEEVFKLGNNVSQIPFPPQALRFMNEDDAQFIKKGDNILNDALGYVNPETVFDVGCGYGRLAYALQRKKFDGRYVGIDILPRHIQWLQKNFTDEHYRFELHDVKNDRYNPAGKLSTRDAPLDPGFAPDLTLILSVFTHMYEDDIENYLTKVRSILGPRSVVYATFFILTGDERRRPFRFVNKLSESCSYHSEEDPLHAIAYDEAFLRSMFDRIGFVCRYMAYRYQDVAVLMAKE